MFYKWHHGSLTLAETEWAHGMSHEKDVPLQDQPPGPYDLLPSGNGPWLHSRGLKSLPLSPERGPHSIIERPV